jgi:SH3 domain protein
MRNTLKSLIYIIIFMLACGTQAEAENGAGKNTPQRVKFVDDRLIAYVRAGQDESQKVVETVNSGSELIILQSNEKYSKVQTKSGKTGWLLNRFIRDDPAAEQKLLLSQKQIALLESRLEQKDQELATVNKGHNDLRKRFEDLEAKLRRIEAENRHVKGLAADPLKLARQNQTLELERSQLESELRMLRGKLDNLADEAENRWFLTGAGVVFMSLLIGLMMPRFKQRKSSWSSLG